MRLSDVDISKKLASGEIVVSPTLDPDHIGSCSIDLCLGEDFRIFDATKFSSIEFITEVSEHLMKDIHLEQGEQFFLHPGEFALGVTKERVTLSDAIAGWLDGRSSLARLGLMVHITAHTIDPGWDGHLTLEFYNSGKLPLALHPGMRICALSFEELSSPTSKPYAKKESARYRDQTSPRLGRGGSAD